MSRHFFISKALIIAAFLVSGCGKSPEQKIETPAADPRFASATALLEYYNSIATIDPVNAVAVYDMCYAENDFQKRYITDSRRMQPFAELDRLMFEKFGECFNPKKKTHMLAPDHPATMIKQDDQRAEAELVNSDGERQVLRLVHIGDRWWISGYSFEYAPDINEYRQNVDSLERLADDLSRASPLVSEQIRNGTITSAREARLAMGSALAPKN